MKKVLLVTRNFPPLNGGMERLNYHIYLELNQDFNTLVAGPLGSSVHLAPETRHCEFPHKPLFAFLWDSFWKTLVLCSKEKPELIIAGSGATALSAWLIGYICKTKVVTFVHGLDLVVSNPLYQMLFLPAIRNCDAVLVNSHNTGKLAIKKGIASNKIKTIYPGVALPKPASKSIMPNRFKAEIGIAEDSIILLSVGRLTERKGLVEFILHSLPNIVKAEPRCVLVIIGDEPNNALHHKVGVKEKIIQAVRDSGLNNHVFLLGHVSESQLEEAYQCSHLHVFPGIDLPGDIEGFGMVAIEAAAHGLPTVAFAVGGVPEAVNHGVSGWLIKPSDYPAMTEAVLNGLVNLNSINNQVNEVSCRQHAAKFSWEIFGNNLRHLCDEISTN